MNEKTKKAIEILEKENLTLVLLGEGETIKSTERGVAALLKLYGEGKDLSSFCAADKVVGKGAAVLFSLLKVREVYSEVMSKGAKKIFEENGIPAFFKTSCEYIINRRGNGLCPIEEAVGDETDLEKALELIKNRIAVMKKTAEK